MKETIRRLSEELGLKESTITRTYKAYWQFIRQTIVALPLKEEWTEEEFNKLQTNFNLPNLGKLACPYKRWKGVRDRGKRLNKKENAKYKEDSANG